MKRTEILAQFREDCVERIAASREAIKHLSNPNVIMTRREGTNPPEDLKAILLADHHTIIANAEATIRMIDEETED